LRGIKAFFSLEKEGHPELVPIAIDKFSQDKFACQPSFLTPV